MTLRSEGPKSGHSVAEVGSWVVINRDRFGPLLPAGAVRLSLRLESERHSQFTSDARQSELVRSHSLCFRLPILVGQRFFRDIYFFATQLGFKSRQLCFDVGASFALANDLFAIAA